MTGGRKREPIRHGTPGGHRTHYRHGVPPCLACKIALSEYNRRRRIAAIQRRYDGHGG